MDLLTILLFLVVLMVLIFVHELGHFSVAKYFGIRVDEFGIGFPPKIFGTKRGETEYTLNWFPIGGFVRIFGEDPDDASLHGPDAPRAMVNKSKWIQAAVLVAGVTFNILFAWLLFVGGFMLGMPSALDPEQVAQASDVRLLITEVLPESPAAAAGLAPSDQIVALADQRGEQLSGSLTPEAVSGFIEAHSTGTLALTLVRDGATTTATVTPSTNVVPGEPERPAVGFVMSLSGIVTLPPHEALWEATTMTAGLLGAIVVALGGFFAQAFTLSADLSQVAGPVGIVSLVGDAAALGIPFLITFTAFISLNLAVINLLPVPALDGGRLLFVFIEAVKGSPIPPRIANAVNTAGFAFLILLIILITFNDIVRLAG